MKLKRGHMRGEHVTSRQGLPGEILWNVRSAVAQILRPSEIDGEELRSVVIDGGGQSQRRFLHCSDADEEALTFCDTTIDNGAGEYASSVGQRVIHIRARANRRFSTRELPSISPSIPVGWQREDSARVGSYGAREVAPTRSLKEKKNIFFLQT